MLRLPVEVRPGTTGALPVSIQVFVNDVPAFGRAGLALTADQASAKSMTLQVPLGAGRNKVQLAACDRTGASSLRETFYVHRSAVGLRPRRYILSVGVADYNDAARKLVYAGKDASDVVQALRAPGNRETRTLLLRDKGARRADILAAKSFLAHSRPEDEIVVYVSGHGTLSKAGEYFFCPTDFEFATDGNGVSIADLESLFEGAPALARLLLVGTCHAGELSEEDARATLAGKSPGRLAKGIELFRRR